jgi:hypothetical protein
MASRISPHSGWFPRDAEVAADVGDDGADGAAADACGDLLGRGELIVGSRWQGVGVRTRSPRCGGAGGRWSGAGVQPGGNMVDEVLERGGEPQAASDPRQDQRDVACAEWQDEAIDIIARAGLAEGGCKPEAIVDHTADEGKKTAGTGWFDLDARHEHNKNIRAPAASRHSLGPTPICADRRRGRGSPTLPSGDIFREPGQTRNEVRADRLRDRQPVRLPARPHLTGPPILRRPRAYFESCDVRSVAGSATAPGR